MKYGITKIVLGFPGFIEIEEKEYVRYLQALSALSEALYLEEKFDFVIGDYSEYVEE